MDKNQIWLRYQRGSMHLVALVIIILLVACLLFLMRAGEQGPQDQMANDQVTHMQDQIKLLESKVDLLDMRTRLLESSKSK